MRLGVNIDHVATIRQARGIDEPDPVTAAALAELAGAHGIVSHLREDRRHIQDRDLRILKETVKTHLNMEMAATDEMVRIALNTIPDMCTLVPERREELTTEGGLDVVSQADHLKEVVTELRGAGIVVSLFVDATLDQVKASEAVGAQVVELHTGPYCEAKGVGEAMVELGKLEDMALAADKLGMRVSAGHGLNYRNVVPVASIPQVEELNIGHSIIARSVMVGIEMAVREMLDLIMD
ncbi:pyridoxine 5'-phosphate synthase [bacterium SM23_57]|nr:MAG: pyridoxine 5'-phosphate synthase [bacterium SM23_57]